MSRISRGVLTLLKGVGPPDFPAHPSLSPLVSICLLLSLFCSILTRRIVCSLSEMVKALRGKVQLSHDSVLQLLALVSDVLV